MPDGSPPDNAPAMPMKVVFVGCGYVADYYANNIRSHPDFALAGVVDRDPARLKAFCDHYRAPALPSLAAALADPSVGMILNLTNPREHFAVTKAAIEAGKHVYSEKPLGMDGPEARAVADLARAHGVRLASAPCHVLSETIVELARIIESGVIGAPTLAYIAFDDGMIAPHEKPWTWLSEAGAPWPAKDEFEIGCTYEHAGYCLSILAGLFGPARSVTAHASVQVADKGIPVDVVTPDFSVGVISYDNGVVARVTNGLVAPVDKALTVVGTESALRIRHLRDDRHGIEILNEGGWRWQLRRYWRRFVGYPGDIGLWRPYRKPTGPKFAYAGVRNPVDYFRGPQDMLDAIRAGRPHRLSAELGVHITELTETLQYPERFGHHRTITSEFAPLKLTEMAR